jgi:hypothetical protein
MSLLGEGLIGESFEPIHYASFYRFWFHSEQEKNILVVPYIHQPVSVVTVINNLVCERPYISMSILGQRNAINTHRRVVKGNTLFSAYNQIGYIISDAEIKK